MNSSLIAPCGMNCGICSAYLREKNVCNGCWGEEANKRSYCTKCAIKNCDLLENTQSMFCYDCIKYPCHRLKNLDIRYKTKYKMSMIENLNNIKNLGLDIFLQIEQKRWYCKSCGGTICVHKGYCLKCFKN